MTALGLLLGLGGAVAATRVLETLLFDVSPVDPGTYVIVAIGLAIIAMVASWIPARRAALVHPSSALRVD